MSKTFIGTVSSDKPDKTIVVNITRQMTHTLYRKRYSASRRIAAHDEKNEAKMGDKVEIVACRPFSATKRFKLSKIIEKPKLREDALRATVADDSAKIVQADKADQSTKANNPDKSAKKEKDL